MACALASFAAPGMSSARADSQSDEAATSGMAIPEKARFLADRGRQLQRDGKFAEALEAYKAAYVLAPSPGLLFNLAQAYRLNGDCDDAAWMYRRFLDTDPRDDLRSARQRPSREAPGLHARRLSHADRDPRPCRTPPKDKAMMPSQPPRASVVAAAEPRR